MARQHFLGRISDVILGPGKEVETDLAKPPCERCNPDFRPQPDSLGRPRPPVGLCSSCVSARVGSRVIEPAERPDVSRHHPSQLSPRAAEAVEAWEAKRAAQPGYAAPGSDEEHRALSIIEAHREEDEKLKHRGGLFRRRGVLEVPIQDIR